MGHSVIQAELKRLHSPDAADLKSYKPAENFGILLQAMVGPAGAEGEESFDVMVCTPQWFADSMEGDIVSGRHYLFVKEYNYERLFKFFDDFCRSCSNVSWQGVAQKIGGLGRWEFEEYVPFS